ncbi:inorganic phosphate cotransporter, partial [Nephila pilipes]
MVENILNTFRKQKKSYSVAIYNITAKLEPTLCESTHANRTCCIGRRYVVTILGFILCCLMNINRLVIGVAIVAMVKHGHKNETTHRNESELSCPLRSTSSSSTIKSEYQGEFDWDSKQQGYVLGAGFFGYLVIQVFGGKVADTVGAKSPLVVSNILMGLLTFISPFAAWWNIYALLAVQFVRGLSQGFVTPCVYRMMSNWFPKHERGFLSTLVVCGFAFGAMIGGVVTGWLCDIPHLGWPSAFYFW